MDAYLDAGYEALERSGTPRAGNFLTMPGMLKCYLRLQRSNCRMNGYHATVILVCLITFCVCDGDNGHEAVEVWHMPIGIYSDSVFRRLTFFTEPSEPSSEAH